MKRKWFRETVEDREIQPEFHPPDLGTPAELIAEARKIGPTTIIGTQRWLPSDHIHQLADALEACMGRETDA